ncbi:sulfonate ABC transporter periplasmic sulfonate-binding protein [Salinisphaera shabanensis T35B1]|uniref:ABC transporter substrate-binding protein n=1 Tax=Salinisphaera shabanensis E1L3A TaxID=1033802 RepID=U2END9_9GAMM|nr:ABC transporter substrate-binding protein [Salinisphaera shabanensis]ERJ19647.1 ABC transporter substrate-binding protein [Salinisphaera shabanensis E1L3A]
MTTPARVATRLWLAGLILLAAWLVGCSADTPDNAADPLRVGVLKFGTVSWEMETIQRNGLAEKHDVAIEVVPLASENALAVALQGGRVDLIVSDWLWAARQRAENRNYQFAPYSLAVGAVMVNPASGVETLADLANRKLGIAGGPVDKTWLLLRAYAQKTQGMDLERVVEPTFAAPPMINRLLLDGDLPAAVNFWHYNARLSALGMRPLLSVEQMLAGLGIDTVPPLLGWVFAEDWADEHRTELQHFLAASQDAKRLLNESDEAWAPLEPMIKPESEAVFAAIRDGYRAGIIKRYGAPEIAAAGQLFDLLATESDGQLTGGVTQLSADVFWDGYRQP